MQSEPVTVTKNVTDFSHSHGILAYWLLKLDKLQCLKKLLYCFM